MSAPTQPTPAGPDNSRSLAELAPVKFTLPVYWASYLINGDASGLEPGEQETIDAWHKARNLPAPADCEDQGFSWTNDATNLGGDVAEYTYLLPVGHPERYDPPASQPDPAAEARKPWNLGDPDDPAETSLPYRENPARDDIPAPDSPEDHT